jgi:hypothetical protein
VQECHHDDILALIATKNLSYTLFSYRESVHILPSGGKSA